MSDKCVICGEIIPEGRQVCPNCESESKNMNKFCNAEANICLKCKAEKCNGNCKRFAEKKKKLKGKNKNER